MANATSLALMYLAVGAALFAQPRPGTATPDDFTWRAQLAIFRRTLPLVLLWPVALARQLRA